MSNHHIATLIIAGKLLLVINPLQAAVPPVKANWTVMVYMNAKNDLECAALDNIAQMQAATDQRGVNVVVELGRPKVNSPCHAPAWSAVRRFHVSPQSALTGGIRLPDKDPDGNMGRGSTLARFVQWSMNNYPAHHYMLVIWGHGQGFRFELTSRRAAPSPSERSDPIGGVKSISYDPDFKTYLFIRDIADSLGEVLHGRLLDVIGFDACLMGGIENAYALRKVARFMVGSEEVIPDAGWDYSDVLWRMIAGGAGSEPRLVAWMLVESYRNVYRNIGGLTLSALDLARVESVATSVSLLAEALNKQLQDSSFVELLLSIRGNMCNYGLPAGYSNPVDLQAFLEGLSASRAGGGEVQNNTESILRELRAFVVAHHPSAPPTQANFGSHGVSIYFPPSLNRWNTDPHDDGGYDKSICSSPRRFPVAFVCDKKWADFLLAYLQAIPSLVREPPACAVF